METWAFFKSEVITIKSILPLSFCLSLTYIQFMYQPLDLLIQKYERHLASGERNLKELELFDKLDTTDYRTQKLLLGVWAMVLKDFNSLSDKSDNDHTKKRN